MNPSRAEFQELHKQLIKRGYTKIMSCGLNPEIYKNTVKYGSLYSHNSMPDIWLNKDTYTELLEYVNISLDTFNLMVKTLTKE